jgi:hypothetical protein
MYTLMKILCTALLSMLCFVSCKKKSDTPTGPVYKEPTVSTSAVTITGASTATSGGVITDDGGDPVTIRGVAWAAQPNFPFLNCWQTIDGFNTGTYTSNITYLLPHTTYYVRAYAANGKGFYGFGKEISFTMP